MDIIGKKHISKEMFTSTFQTSKKDKVVIEKEYKNISKYFESQGIPMSYDNIAKHYIDSEGSKVLK